MKRTVICGFFIGIVILLGLLIFFREKNHENLQPESDQNASANSSAKRTLDSSDGKKLVSVDTMPKSNVAEIAKTAKEERAEQIKKAFAEYSKQTPQPIEFMGKLWMKICSRWRMQAYG